jgi:hypothetical protein
MTLCGLSEKPGPRLTLLSEPESIVLSLGSSLAPNILLPSPSLMQFWPYPGDTVCRKVEATCRHLVYTYLGIQYSSSMGDGDHAQLNC